MAILCGTDFSEMSNRAVAAAGHLAQRMKLPLHLVHSLDVGPEDVYDEAKGSLVEWAGRQLRRQAERLRRHGTQVDVHVKTGTPDVAVLDTAKEVSAKLIVVAALGRRQPGQWKIGSHADRIAQRSHVPVLVVRDALPYDAWVRESRPLRILFGADYSVSSEIAMRWVNELRAFGPCEVVAAHLYWPPEQFHRLGLGGVRSYVDPDPEVTKALERDFSERYSRLPGAGPLRFRLEPHLGRLGDRLADIAAEEKVDLVVVGSHDRDALDRLWEGSVSRGVLHWAKTSVACIPAPASALARATPKLQTVLAATDFSPIADAAIPLAFASAAPGGTVHLVHVVKGHRSSIEPHDIFDRDKSNTAPKAEGGLHDRLLSLVPADAQARGLSAHVHVLESLDVAHAISQAAERLAADLICLGTHGRTGLTKALLGSVAQAVLEKTRRPVLLARAPLE